MFPQFNPSFSRRWHGVLCLIYLIGLTELKFYYQSGLFTPCFEFSTVYNSLFSDHFSCHPLSYFLVKRKPVMFLELLCHTSSTYCCNSVIFILYFVCSFLIRFAFILFFFSFVFLINYDALVIFLSALGLDHLQSVDWFGFIYYYRSY